MKITYKNLTRPITSINEAMEYPERVINMDAMNYGEHIGDIEGKYFGKNMLNMNYMTTFQILIVCEKSLFYCRTRTRIRQGV